MRMRTFQSFSFVLLIALLSLVLRCTPSPKYRGNASSQQQQGDKRSSGSGVPAPDRELILSAPLQNYSESRITSGFGLRRDPRYKTEEFHYGIDIKAGEGEHVFAAAAGTVVFAGRQRGFGKLIIIDHGGRVSTVYGHLSNCTVREGEPVERGDFIGTVGRTGNATGIHLHFEVRKAGKALNPLDYL
ncbi:MAG TPA: M23 family metallopeptidase [Patescibacteria group bacterium]|nr:M23 family metallopeptidase [Patescibacteria group bacterium]